MSTRPESYLKVLGNLLGVIAGLAGIAAVMLSQKPSPTEPKPMAVVTSAPVVQPKKAPKPRPKPVPTPIVAPAPKLPATPHIDEEAVSKAESAVATATRQRLESEARAREAARLLDEAKMQAAVDAKATQNLAGGLEAPTARIEQAEARGGFLKTEIENLKGEIATYAQAPRPKAKVLTNKNPVARPADGSEHHFELRKNRVAYIDLDTLISLVKKDVELRIRLADGARLVESRVGPVGPFALQYEFRKALPSRLDDLIDRRALTYRPSGWEIVPEFEGRGETFEASRQSISEFARVIHRLTPGKATITLWVYPDSFDLYRKLRDDLQARGYLVAGRPMPEGMAIRGGPGGSVSAGQ